MCLLSYRIKNVSETNELIRLMHIFLIYAHLAISVQIFFFTSYPKMRIIVGGWKHCYCEYALSVTTTNNTDIKQLKHEFTKIVLYNSVLTVMLFLRFLQQFPNVVLVVISCQLKVWLKKKKCLWAKVHIFLTEMTAQQSLGVECEFSTKLLKVMMSLSFYLDPDYYLRIVHFWLNYIQHHDYHEKLWLK